jgi:putative endonuclease
MLDLRLRFGEVGDGDESFGFGLCYHAGSLGSSFRDGPKDQTRNLEISLRPARPGLIGWLEQSVTIMAYYVYILASRRDGATYVGMTNDLVRRVFEHRQKAVPSFASKYNITRLVWFEIYEDPISAISREKELKKWKREWKVRLIEVENPQWLDLHESICK